MPILRDQKSASNPPALYDEAAERAEALRPRAWRKGPGRLADTAAPALASAAAKLGFADGALIRHWRDIVGAEIGALARPHSLKGATLTLRVDGAAAILVRHQTRLIAERVNAYLGRDVVVTVKLVPGAPAPAAPAAPILPALTQTERAAIDAALAAARTPALKQRLEALFSASLARAKRR